jgi:Mn2+/Fe2+ NRAMP family transporter
LKVTVLWVVVVGAALKFVLCEGLARWQLATGASVPSGVFRSTPTLVQFSFLGYVAVWSFCIGGMLMSACGECAQAILPIGEPAFGRVVHGCMHSIVAIALVWLGGFWLFERLMAVCIGVMFITVLVVATLSAPEWSAVVTGLIVPKVPHADGDGVAWTMTLMAGVGGTLTMLCYGNWIREKGRADCAESMSHRSGSRLFDDRAFRNRNGDSRQSPSRGQGAEGRQPCDSAGQ